jgi:hypothetical protein
MKFLITIASLLLSIHASAGGLLGDITSELGRVSKQVDRANASVLDSAVRKIERAELAQNLQVDALVKRVVELEETVRKQQDLLSQYQKVVLELQAKTGGGK